MSRLGYTEALVSLARMFHLGRILAADLPHYLGVLEKDREESIQEVDSARMSCETPANLLSDFRY